jgi:hypothetical protein
LLELDSERLILHLQDRLLPLLGSESALGGHGLTDRKAFVSSVVAQGTVLVIALRMLFVTSARRPIIVSYIVGRKTPARNLRI